MIDGYADRSANERTFLAWVRTGIAVIAFGFVIEKFNLFIRTLASTDTLASAYRSQLEKLQGSLGRYEGLALIALGIALVILAAVRFAKTEWMLDDREMHSPSGVRTELIFSAVLVLIAVGLSAYLALGG